MHYKFNTVKAISPGRLEQLFVGAHSEMERSGALIAASFNRYFEHPLVERFTEIAETLPFVVFTSPMRFQFVTAPLEVLLLDYRGCLTRPPVVSRVSLPSWSFGHGSRFGSLARPVSPDLFRSPVSVRGFTSAKQIWGNLALLFIIV